MKTDRQVNSLFKVTPYHYKYLLRERNHYPTFKLRGDGELYFMTLEEAEVWMQGEARRSEGRDTNVYAYVVTELPIGMEISTSVRDEYLSLCIYLPDGTLWGSNMYPRFMPHEGNSQQTMAWRVKNTFWGRDPEEIKFCPGDIVEVLGCPGNWFWGAGEVNLAIVCGTPETKEQVSARKECYMATHQGFDITDAGMAYEFDDFHDTYEVIPYGCDFIDHAPTICVFQPSLLVSTRKRETLQKVFNALRRI